MAFTHQQQHQQQVMAYRGVASVQPQNIMAMQQSPVNGHDGDRRNVQPLALRPLEQQTMTPL